MRKYTLLLAIASFSYACAPTKSYIYSRGADGQLRVQEHTDYPTNIPLKAKIKKRDIHPTINFVESVKEYRRTFHHFPQDLWNLQNLNDRSRSAFKDMTEIGFTDLRLHYVYLDSFVVAFVHKPVYDPKLGGKNLGKEVAGKFIFTYQPKDSTFLYVKTLD
ncbi:MAG: hypothetical protein J7623_28400 [Chitinophaga sp.]|uniref:hypothetical protein n=1 Tax=Chitinophaga sp. TaxID=1869181 RepID=UPI001B260CD0|nr:hypothetical protein [Chitinophaga sp.]MBO9732598.1 hypothetical protein [Chitinophaga sp.]